MLNLKMLLFANNPILPIKRLKSPDSSLLGGRVYFFRLERIQSLISAHMGQQGRLFVLHYVDHQFHAKPEAGDEHIPFRDRGYVRDALGDFV